jgi:hypothetical protein
MKKKKMAAVALALAGAMSLSACATPQTSTLAGGAIGSPGGANAGAGTSALIMARPRWRCRRWGFDQFGDRRCLAWIRFSKAEALHARRPNPPVPG